MKAIEKNGYYYDPPSWRVCPECGGSATVETEKKSGIGSMLNGAVYTMTEKCPKCANSPRPGYLPIRYAPKEWQAAGGILTDDTPVWIWIEDDFMIGNWELFRCAQRYEQSDIVIIATTAGPPKEERK